MGQIGQTLGGLVGIGQNPGLDTYGAGTYGQNYSSLLSGAQTNLNSINTNESSLASQYGNIAAGQGPNPAQAMLNQSTGQNVKNQAALQAGQRGAGANVGLMARQAAQTGANVQQQAAGQGATMQANQQLSALGQQGSIYAQQGQQQNSAMGAYEAAINGSNQINAQTAANQAQFGQGFGGGLLTGIGSMLAKGGEVENFDSGGMSGDSDSGGGNSFIGQFLSGLGQGQSGGNGAMSKKGAGGHGIISGTLKGMKGMSRTGANNPMSGSDSLGASSSYDPNLTVMGNQMAASPGMAAGNAGYAGADMGSAAAGASEASDTAGSIGEMLAAKGGKVSEKKAVKARVSPGEGWIPPEAVKEVKKGNLEPVKNMHVFPGKPKVNKDSYSNDVLPRDLPEGGFVIPLHVMQSKDPVRGSAQFVRDYLAKKRMKA